MKWISAIAILLTSTLTYAACPNLDGKYLCEYQDENGETVQNTLDIKLIEQNGTSIYAMAVDGSNPQGFYADGEERQYSDGESEFSITSSCKDENIFNILVSQVVTTEELGEYDVDVTIDYTLDADNNLKRDTKVTYTQGELVYDYDYTETCARQ